MSISWNEQEGHYPTARLGRYSALIKQPYPDRDSWRANICDTADGSFINNDTKDFTSLAAAKRWCGERMRSLVGCGE